MKTNPKYKIELILNLFISLIIFSLLLSIIYIIYRTYNPIYFDNNKFSNTKIIYLLIITFIIIFNFFLLASRLYIKLYFFFISIIVIFSFIIFEILLQKQYLSKVDVSRYKSAKSLNIEFDKRSRVKVIYELNKNKLQVYPNVVPQKFVRSNGIISIKNNQLFPLSGIANVETLLTNEGGFFPVLKYDELGFNNVKVFSDDNLDILLLGDSFSEGYSVNQEDTISANLNKLDFTSYSIGRLSSGSLLKLAQLKEYTNYLKPKIVVWQYYVGDNTEDLIYEKKSSILMNYLNIKDYNQDLFNRRDEINETLKILIKSEIKNNSPFIRMVKFYNTRFFLNNLFKKLKNEYKSSNSNQDESKIKKSNQDELLLFNDILNEAKRFIEEHNIKLYFLYLPSYEKIFSKKNINLINNVFKIVKSNKIPIIDIEELVFKNHKDPLSLFPLRHYGHYNALGYKHIADVINNRIIKDNLN